MDNKTLTLTGDDAVAVLTLSRAHCLDIGGKHELVGAISSLSRRTNLRALIINANDSEAWLVNVAELVEMTPAAARAFSNAGHQLADAIARLPVPVIAAVDAPALGGGCELVLACDIAFAGPNGRFGQIEALGGVLPAFGGTWRLARRVGHQRAMRMLFTGEVVDAETAKAIGLVMDVVPSADLIDRAQALAVQIAKTSSQSVAAIKRVVEAGTHSAPSVISALEEEAFGSLFGTEDQQGRMRAFLASRPEPREQADQSNEAVTFIQVWEVGTREHQAGWLTTMRDKVGVLTRQPGFASMRTYASADGKRVAVSAQWRDRASLEAAVGTPEAKAGHQAMRAHGTPNGAIYNLSDVFLPNPVAPLVERVGKRWTALGFGTGMVNVNGVDLHLASGGHGSPLVLLHGYPQSGEIWRFVAPELAKTHRVIIPDLRGMGLSAIVRDSFDLPTLADDMHQLIASLGHEQAEVVGHDWGGAVAAVWALRHRGDVRRLVFIESAVAGAGFERMWAFERPNPAMTFIPFLLTDPLAESLIAGREEIFLYHLWNTFTHNKSRIPFAAWEPYVDAMKRPGLIRSSASYYRSAYDAIDRIRELIGAGKLTIPVLSVSGQASFGESQKPFVEAFADNVSKHVIVADSGHFVAEEQPEALMAELRAFLAS